MTSRIGIFLAIVLITALGYLLFPAYTWLQQDTQIYVPIFEHLYDPGVLAEDPVAIRPHVGYTIYDELIVGLRRITDASTHTLMAADQILFRAAGVLGVFLIAGALGLPARLALLVAGIYALGASVMGPAVLTVEYEPKPRGSAIGMLLLAIGLIGHSRYLSAGALASLAFLYHPPTTYPFWAVMGAYVIWPKREKAERRFSVRAFLPLLAAAGLLFVLSRLQSGGAESQSWMATLSPELERLQRYRASYNWISTWIGQWVWHYTALLALAVCALYRLRPAAPRPLWFFLAGLPVAGALSVPFAWLTYDVGGWALMAKFQPARALLWIPLVTVILAAVSSLRASVTNRLVAPFLWGAVAFAIPIEHNIWTLFWPDLGEELVWRRLALAAALALLLALAGWLYGQSRRLAWIAWGLALVTPFIALPYIGAVVTEQDLHHAELEELSEWASENTPLDAVFLFVDIGKGRQPGIFRAKALRAVYTDWKSGGQVNMVEGFALDWWERYSQTAGRDFTPADMERYAELGIDYVVMETEHRLPDRKPVFENDKYLVYALPPPD